MKRFKNILVGVDLSVGDRFVGVELTPPSEEALRRALWLARLNGARLHLLYALDISPHAQRLIQKATGSQSTVMDAARDKLAELVERVRHVRVEAASSAVYGKSWLELIRQVLRGGHDLVVSGTRSLGAMHGMLVGSTGKKLLRKCPCPVWITQPRTDEAISRILVATDLTPVGATALELGHSMASLHDAQLHVLYVLDNSEELYLRLGSVPVGMIQDHRNSAEQAARITIAEQLDRLGADGLSHSPAVHVIEGWPADSIADLISRESIELLVMGTVARSGVQGFFMGNTAERLLPQVACSILAVKPEGFVSPVTLD